MWLSYQIDAANSAALVKAIRRSGAVITNLRTGQIPVIQIATPDACSARKLAARLKEQTLVTNPQVRESGTGGSWVVQIDGTDTLTAGLLQRGDHLRHRQRVTARFDLEQHDLQAILLDETEWAGRRSPTALRR